MTGTYLPPFFQLLTQQPTWVLHRHGKLDSSQPEQEKSASMYINSKCIRYLIHYMKMGQSWGSLKSFLALCRLYEIV